MPSSTLLSDKLTGIWLQLLDCCVKPLRRVELQSECDPPHSCCTADNKASSVNTSRHLCSPGVLFIWRRHRQANHYGLSECTHSKHFKRNGVHRKFRSTWMYHSSLCLPLTPPLSLPQLLYKFAVHSPALPRLPPQLSLFRLNGWVCMYWHNSSSATQQCEGSGIQLGVSLMIRLMRVARTQACLHELLQEDEERRGYVRRTGEERRNCKRRRGGEET